MGNNEDATKIEAEDNKDNDKKHKIPEEEQHESKKPQPLRQGWRRVRARRILRVA